MWGGGGRSSVLSKESLVKYIGSVCVWGGGEGGWSGMIVTILFYLALNGVVKLSSVWDKAMIGGGGGGVDCGRSVGCSTIHTQ